MIVTVVIAIEAIANKAEKKKLVLQWDLNPWPLH